VLVATVKIWIACYFKVGVRMWLKHGKDEWVADKGEPVGPAHCKFHGFVQGRF